MKYEKQYGCGGESFRKFLKTLTKKDRRKMKVLREYKVLYLHNGRSVATCNYDTLEAALRAAKSARKDPQVSNIDVRETFTICTYRDVLP